jgi:hypothetical protein
MKDRQIQVLLTSTPLMGSVGETKPVIRETAMDDVPEDNAILTLIVHQPAKEVAFITGF